MPIALFSAEKYQSIPDPRVQNSAIDLEISTTEARIELTRVDFWDGYLVFVGTVRALDATICISRTDFSLRIDSIAYEPLERDKTRNGYNMDAPGTGFFTQCISGGEREVILLPFAAPVSNGRAVLSYDGESAALSQSLAQLQTVTQAAVPTPTPTPTYTPTPSPTPTATFTPAAATFLTERPDSFTLPVPSSARSVFHRGKVNNVGVEFSLERIDYWERLPDGITPDGVFAVLTGTLSRSNIHPGGGCVSASDVVVIVDGVDYEMDYMRSVQEFYQVDFPGYFFPQCASSGSAIPTFMVFDIPSTAKTATLSFHDAQLNLTLFAEDEVAQVAEATPLPEATTPAAEETPQVEETPRVEEVTQEQESAIQEQTNQSPAAATVAAVFTATAEAVASQNSQPSETVQPTPTNTPRPTNTPTSIPTRPAIGIVVRDANLRAGPGTTFDVVGSASSEDEVEIAGMNSAADWYYLATGEWIAAFLVDEVVGVVPTLTPSPTSTATPVPTSTPTPNAAATANAIQGAQATATIEARVYTPPTGTWCAQSSTRGVCVGDFRYARTAGYSSAPSNGRFIAFGVYVKNLSSGSIHVNPNDLTIVMADGRTYAYSSATFSYWSTPLEGVNIAPGNAAEGGIVFLVPNDVEPQTIIYETLSFFESSIEIDLRDVPSSD